MLQLMQAYSAVFGGGNMVKPYFIDEVRSSYNSSEVLYKAETEITGTPIKQETAEYLQTGGNEVFEVEMVDAMGAVGFPLMIMDATSSLAKLGVRTMPGHKLLEIRENSILLEDNAGYRIEEACDAVIVALGARAQNTLEEALKPDMKVFTAGDAKRGGRRIPDAIHEAFQVALLL
jgi:membrane carboxypeptidase/penicillin-binding protein